MDKLYFNGINGDDGKYDLEPMTGDELSSLIQGQASPENLNDLAKRHRDKTEKHLGVKAGVDPTKLSEAGWGIIFPHGVDPAIKEALSPLIEHRRNEANKKHEFFKIYEGPDAHRPGESKSEFLGRHGVGWGPADPDKMPYYLLIVGDPERIPNRFQSQLDVQYAVGRIHFDTPEEYDNYARSVVAAETGPVKLSRDVAMFSVANDDDPATQLSTKSLMRPLLEYLKTDPIADGWDVSNSFVDTATKSQLQRLLGGDQTPALLFTASHGMKFNLGSPRQLPHQGALLCQDWPGPEKHEGPVPQDHYFAGDDLGSDANLLGLIGFFFACFGAGTPRFDEFARQAGDDNRAEIAPRNFLAQLPLKMLSHPRGGALAVIGHVDRAWSYSFDWPGAGAQTVTFESTLHRLLEGYPVGAAVEFFNERYAALAVTLSDLLEEIDFGMRFNPYELAGLWTANNDARGYAILGDPAVRLPVAKPGQESVERPAIDLSTTSGGDPVTPVSAPAGGDETTAEDQPAAFHTVTITTYTGATEDDKKIAAETTLAVGSDQEVIETGTTTADDAALQEAHQTLVQEVKAACEAYNDPPDSSGDQE